MENPEKRPVAIVTGGANGIGFAIAEAFCKAGYDLGIVDLNLDQAEAAALRLSETTGAKTDAAAADVSDEAASGAAYAALRATLGPANVLINNAGNFVRQKGWIEALPLADYDLTMNIHVRGAVIWSRLVLPDMRAGAYGRIINMSSTTAICPTPHRMPYVTAKKAILGLTEALALETARAGITVNALAPGFIMTEALQQRADAGVLDEAAISNRTPAGRCGTPRDVAHAALFLADKHSGYVNGVTLPVDGALTIRGDAGEDLDHSPAA